MLAKLHAIVLSHTKYGDSSSIIRAYTENGQISFIAGGVRNKKGPITPGMLLPLTTLQVVYYNTNKSELKRIKEASVVSHYKHLQFDPIKSCVALFLAEILEHCLREEEANPKLFAFLTEELQIFDDQKKEVGNFHLQFLIKLTVHLGFSPELNLQNQPYFDLVNGVYTSNIPDHLNFLDTNETLLWQALQSIIVNEEASLVLNRAKRQEVLQIVLQYYRLHLNDFGKLRTVEVLQTILS